VSAKQVSTFDNAWLVFLSHQDAIVAINTVLTWMRVFTSRILELFVTYTEGAFDEEFWLERLFLRSIIVIKKEDKNDRR